MAIYTTLLADATDSFVLLTTNLAVAAARDAVSEGVLGVVQAPSGEQVATVTDADLDRVMQREGCSLGEVCRLLPPVIVVDQGTTFAEFGDSHAVTLLQLGARALALVDEDEVVAVLPVAVIGAYFASARSVPLSRTVRPYSLARIACAARDCGFVNTLRSFNRRRIPLCANPYGVEHQLLIERRAR